MAYMSQKTLIRYESSKKKYKLIVHTLGIADLWSSRNWALRIETRDIDSWELYCVMFEDKLPSFKFVGSED